MAGSLVLISVGNTRTRFCRASSEAIEPSIVVGNADLGAIVQGVKDLVQAAEADEPACVLASVNRSVSAEIESRLRQQNVRVLSFGRELALPIANALDDDSTVGQDRLLDAIGAYARSKQACIVIDAGTAITVDFVDGEGTFHGGAIAPGVRMMLRAMHEQTSALPQVELTPERIAALPISVREQDAESGGGTRPVPFGKDTASAMIIGAVSAARGLVHELVDRYAEYYEAYPRVVATGGDAPLLFEHDPIVEAIVPDLTLIGMLEAVKLLEDLERAEDGPSDES